MIALVGVLMAVVVADWRSSAAIAVDRRERGFARVVLDDRIDAGPDGRYDELRVFDDRGTLVPFALEQPRTAALTPVRQGAVRTSGDPERWVWDLHGAVTIGGLRVHAASKTFERKITVEYSSDATGWWTAGDATVARYADGTERLGIAFSPRSARYWRLTVDNGDDAPVMGLQPALLARSRTLVFETDPQRRYRLAFDNPDAVVAHFDLADRLAHERWSAREARIVTVIHSPGGLTAPNVPDGVLGVPGPRPSQLDGIGSEILIDACRVVAIVLGAVAVRALRSPR